MRLFPSLNVLALSFLSLGLSFQPALAWQEQTTVDHQEVRVWTKKLEHTNFRAFRGEVLIAVPIQQVFDFIADTPKAKDWYFNTLEAKQLKRLDEKRFLIYSVTDAPWPVSDRDSVTQVSIDDRNPEKIIIQLQAQPNALPENPNRVRIQTLNGFWQLEKVSQAQTKVTFEVAAEPGGMLPSCLANSMAVDMPYQSLKNLKAQLEQQAHLQRSSASTLDAR
ncbi:MAG: hypothetical protein JXR44_06015 [Thiotrichales bacterium]|nr:hypothetical protein [Thiotrichales bacterium]